MITFGIVLSRAVVAILMSSALSFILVLLLCFLFVFPEGNCHSPSRPFVLLFVLFSLLMVPSLLSGSAG